MRMSNRSNETKPEDCVREDIAVGVAKNNEEKIRRNNDE
jgi:hypothetical protein